MSPAVHPVTTVDQLVSKNPRGAVQEKTGPPSPPWVGAGLGMERITNRDRDDFFLGPEESWVSRPSGYSRPTEAHSLRWNGSDEMRFSCFSMQRKQFPGQGALGRKARKGSWSVRPCLHGCRLAWSVKSKVTPCSDQAKKEGTGGVSRTSLLALQPGVPWALGAQGSTCPPTRAWDPRAHWRL